LDTDLVSETPQTCQFNHQINNKQSPNMTMANLRLMSMNNIINRNIQRCAVSRRISTEKNPEEIHSISARQLQISTTNRRISSIKSKTTVHNIQSLINTSSIARPLRAFHMPTMITTESSKKSSSLARHQHLLTIQKTFASRTILTTVLPSSNLIKNRKNN